MCNDEERAMSQFSGDSSSTVSQVPSPAEPPSRTEASSCPGRPFPNGRLTETQESTAHITSSMCSTDNIF